MKNTMIALTIGIAVAVILASAMPASALDSDCFYTYPIHCGHPVVVCGTR